jgi:hypothetical protein
MDIVGVYDDRIKFLQKLGPVCVKRASHVEPLGDGWTADLTPVNGPVLGPFPTRAEALEKEVAWLKQYHLPSFGSARKMSGGQSTESS